MGTKHIKTKVSPEAILSAAETLFSTKGYTATSVTDISKKLKVSKPALYYHFKNKIEILKTLYSLYSISYEEMLSSFEEVMNRDLPPDEKCKKLIENQVKFMAKNINRAKIYFGDYKVFPRKVKNEIKEKRKRFNERWINVYREGIKAGLFRNIDAKIAAYVIVGACNWIQMWYSRNGKLKESELANIMVDLLSKGYLTKA